MSIQPRQDTNPRSTLASATPSPDENVSNCKSFKSRGTPVPTNIVYCPRPFEKYTAWTPRREEPPAHLATVSDPDAREVLSKVAPGLSALKGDLSLGALGGKDPMQLLSTLSLSLDLVTPSWFGKYRLLGLLVESGYFAKYRRDDGTPFRTAEDFLGYYVRTHDGKPSPRKAWRGIAAASKYLAMAHAGDKPPPQISRLLELARTRKTIATKAPKSVAKLLSQAGAASMRGQPCRPSDPPTAVSGALDEQAVLVELNRQTEGHPDSARIAFARAVLKRFVANCGKKSADHPAV